MASPSKRGIAAVVGLVAFTALIVASVVQRGPFSTRSAEPVRVFATSEFAGVLLTGVPPAVSQLGSSTAFSTQLREGRPGAADVFLAGNAEDARRVADVGRCTPPVSVATDELVLLTTAPRGTVRTWRDLAALPPTRVLADEAGKASAYANRVLRKLRLENAGGRDLRVRTAAVDELLAGDGAAFVLRSRAARAGLDAREISLPTRVLPDVGYWACAVRFTGADQPRAERFIAALRSERSRDELLAAGFDVPESN